MMVLLITVRISLMMTPDWVDTDGDGASDDVDAFPDDKTQWEAATP